MSGRQSLSAGLDSIGRKGGGGARGGSGGGKGDTVKLFVAIGLFLIAGLVLAWYYDLLPGFGGQSTAAPPTPEQEKLIQESQEIQKKESLRKDVEIGSS